jgi:undecaprenyl pyrophosphate phosphatase UppP
MPLSNLVVHAAVQAFAEALGASGAAHALVLGLWVEPPDRAVFAGSVGFGSGVAVVLATRARLFPAIAEAARAIGRPGSFLAPGRAREALQIGWIAAVSALFGVALRGAGAEAAKAPHVIAMGLAVTGIALLAGAMMSSARSSAGAWIGDAPRAASGGRSQSGDRSRAASGSRAPTTFEAPSWIAATLAGAAHAFGVWPGVSRVGVAAAVLFALGVKPARALEVVLAATVPFWWIDTVRAFPAVSEIGRGQALVVALFAFLGAYAAVALLRALAARRALAALSLWMIPLACAIFAYGRASLGG